MDAIEFFSHYQGYLSQLESVVKPELLPALQRLRDTDPHDLVSPEHYFNSEVEGVGMVFKLFLRQIQIYRINEEYSQDRNLLPVNDHILRAMSYGLSYSLNIKHQFYFDLASRGYRPYTYMGIYKDKAFRHIGLVENMIEADWDEKIGLSIKNSQHEVTNTQKKS